MEGWWRNGIGAAAGEGGRRIANAEMLERFAGVSGGGTPGMVHGAPNGGGISRLGALGTAGSLFGLVTGGRDMLDSSKSGGERVLGGANALNGLIGSVGGIANMAGVGLSTGTGVLAGAQNLISGMTSLGGAGLGGMGMAGDIGAASTWFGTTAGGAGAGTAAGMGTALATGGAVLGAGLGGIGMGMYGDQHMAETGLLGHRSISDWGADTAYAADQGVTNFIGGERGSIRSGIGGALGTAAGLGTVLGTSILGVPMAIGSSIHGAGSALLGAGSAAAHGIGNFLGL